MLYTKNVIEKLDELRASRDRHDLGSPLTEAAIRFFEDKDAVIVDDVELEEIIDLLNEGENPFSDRGDDWEQFQVACQFGFMLERSFHSISVSELR